MENLLSGLIDLHHVSKFFACDGCGKEIYNIRFARQLKLCEEEGFVSKGETMVFCSKKCYKKSAKETILG